MMIHNVCLKGIGLAAHRMNTRKVPRPALLMVLVAVAHLLQILVFAIAYYVLHLNGWMGGFTGNFDRSWLSYLYFSGICYSTLGMAQFYPTDGFRVLAVIEALTGFLAITWSATFFYSAAGRIVQRDSTDHGND
ncbi:MAG: ion channel [Verrucomicrobiota bacterium]